MAREGPDGHGPHRGIPIAQAIEELRAPPICPGAFKTRGVILGDVFHHVIERGQQHRQGRRRLGQPIGRCQGQGGGHADLVGPIIQAADDLADRQVRLRFDPAEDLQRGHPGRGLAVAEDLDQAGHGDRAQLARGPRSHPGRHA